jgi:hypothetical protein
MVDDRQSGSSSVRCRVAHTRKSLPRSTRNRWAIPRDTWARFFESAEHEIGILAYSGRFRAEDAGLLGIVADKAACGVTVRLSLGDPDSDCIAERGQGGTGDAMAAKVRNALTLFRPLLKCENVGLRLHRTVFYNSLYQADGHLFVNQHAYGIPAAHAPVFCFVRPDAATWSALTSTTSNESRLPPNPSGSAHRDAWFKARGAEIQAQEPEVTASGPTAMRLSAEGAALT